MGFQRSFYGSIDILTFSILGYIFTLRFVYD
ncbi:hypothetical protein E2C01_059975 [Portunus trituberculatus]|uniref:Uncharacterized protein n=1 Tax=Portunus trituberculatus TaxID=210409 RepID=A0A5B7H7M8_PORTR|nr:hypothetical protein [Portunus trituberculatus]